MGRGILGVSDRGAVCAVTMHCSMHIYMSSVYMCGTVWVHMCMACAYAHAHRWACVRHVHMCASTSVHVCMVCMHVVRAHACVMCAHMCSSLRQDKGKGIWWRRRLKKDVGIRRFQTLPWVAIRQA